MHEPKAGTRPRYQLPTGSASEDNLRQYREHLITADQKAQEDYDRAVLSLAGGAFAVSLLFIEKRTGAGPMLHKWLLLAAWLCWSFSIAVVLGSFYSSRRALRKAITQCDAGEPLPPQPGGRMAWTTEALNIIGGTSFVVGLLLIAVFAVYNLGD